MTYVPTARAAMAVQTAAAAVTLTDYSKIVLADATAAAASETVAGTINIYAGFLEYMQLA